MSEKKLSRQKRSKRLRYKLSNMEIKRLVVHRTPRHIYAQLVDNLSGNVLFSVSTLNLDINLKTCGGNIVAASSVGKAFAKKAISMGIDKVTFDRSGFKYHGRVKALAESARESGLNF